MTIQKSDFKCPCSACSNENKIKNEVVELVKKIEKELKFPLRVNSGYRCAAHNKEVGGASKSQHIYGKAADIRPMVRNAKNNAALAKLVKEKWDNGDFGGLGVYNTFRHIDIRPLKTSWKG